MATTKEKDNDKGKAPAKKDNSVLDDKELKSKTIADLLEIFGFFMLVLIGIELLETIKAYLLENIVHVEIVLEVALIAIARKVIILDIEKYSGLTIIGTAALVLAVAAASYAVKRRCKKHHSESQ